MLRCLTLYQPWASLVAIGAKRIETRNWPTSHRGEIAIHASKRWTKEETWLTLSMPFATALGAEARWPALLKPNSSPILPLGAIVAVARLVDVLSTDYISLSHGRLTSSVYDDDDGYFPCGEHERYFGDFSPGRYAWLLTNVRRLATPVPAKGAYMLWQADPAVESDVRAQLAEAPHA